jgi:hypothetical protein
MLEEEMMIRDEGGQIPFLFLLRDPAVHIERTRAAIVVCFAGPAAEEHFLEERFMEGIGQGSDYSNALALAKRITADSKRARQLMIELTGDARKFVRSHWRCITAVAFELRDHGGLDGDQLAEIIERWPIRRAL